jgi:hypothetical protein
VNERRATAIHEAGHAVVSIRERRDADGNWHITTPDGTQIC